MGRSSKSNSNKSRQQKSEKKSKSLKNYPTLLGGEQQMLNDSIISDTDSLFNDASSIVSINSNFSTNRKYQVSDDGIVSGQQSPDYIETNDDNTIISTTNYEDSNKKLTPIDDTLAKLSDILDELLISKRKSNRQNHLDSLIKIFQTKFIGIYLDNRKTTLQQIIESGLKKFDDDTGSIALLLTLTIITIGNEFNDQFQSLYNLLLKIMIDPSAKPSVRSKVAISLSIGCFITDFGDEKIDEILDYLLSIALTNVRTSGGQSLISSQLTEINAFKALCLNLFTFLSTIADFDYVCQLIQQDINKLIKLMDSTDLDIRLSAGTTFAFLYEFYDNNDQEFDIYNLQDLKDKIMKLSNDSNKSQSKKNLRVQRSEFRDILHTIEGNEYEMEIIKFGYEQLDIDSWRMKIYYDIFCSILGSGMNIHLAQNQTLRDIFELGSVLLDKVLISRDTRMNAKQQHVTNRKQREISRSKMRGKRGDFDY
ncbi:interferon-related developmental regulator 1 [Dermatophagoides pteronyssinus]|uniref:interferon-related developmental regulator 1 n=1 Tax=Dermatophagoides pteronyssinus TaxID=6956 RepID=UPI003F67D096